MELTGWDQDASPFHEGEAELQERLGRREVQERMGRRILRPYMPDQHRDFFAMLPLIVTGTVDPEGRPWASVLFGEPGFMSSPDDRRLSIRATPLDGDPLNTNRQAGAPIGLVGVDLPSRRRNRMNGIIESVDDDAMTVSVVQSFGNCPQYIQTRGLHWSRTPSERFVPERVSFSALDDEARAMIRKADTFFVASHNDRDDVRVNGGADVNHRGGRPGFIKVDGNTLTIPDYIGNFAFNTFGNFLVNPKAGLLFIDFETGDLWQLTGTAELLWEPTAEIEAFRGAERAWRFTLDAGQCLRQGAPMRWEFGELSPNSRLTGDWDEAARVLSAEAERDTWRPYRVTRIEDESAVIRSFHLVPADDKGRLGHRPGQFLTIRVTPVDSTEQIRTYTLSSAPSDDHYRISVKRETGDDKPDGVVSSWLHASLAVGDTIEARAPRGDFWLDTAETRPAALFGAGVGITPMISMARQAHIEGLSRRHCRPLTIFHAARSTADRAFATTFSELAHENEGDIRYVSIVDQATGDERAGEDFHAQGRITRDLIQSVLPLADYDCYLCGPPPFMQSIYEMLIELGVADNRIHAESFGPASLQRRPRLGAGQQTAVARNAESADPRELPHGRGVPGAPGAQEKH